MGCRRLSLGLEAALLADPPGRSGRQPSQAGAAANQARLENSAEERARFRATDLQTIPVELEPSTVA